MADIFANLQSLPVTDYNGNTVHVLPRLDTEAPNGPVYVVRLTIGDVSVNLLPEQAAQLSAGVIAAAGIIFGKPDAARKAIQAGMEYTLEAAAAMTEYKIGIYRQPDLAA